MLRRISITNYRSINNATLELPRFAAIFGKNGSGKSNFISAISLIKQLAAGIDLEKALEKIAPIGAELFYFNALQQAASFEFLVENTRKELFKFSYKISTQKVPFPRLAIENEYLTRINTHNDEKEILIYKRERGDVFSEEEKIPLRVEANKLALSSYSNEIVKEIASVFASYTVLVSETEFSEGLQIIDGDRPNLNTIDGVAVSLFLKNENRFTKATESIRKIIPYFEPPVIQRLDDRKGTAQSEKKSEELNKYFVTWKELGHKVSYTHVTLSQGDRRIIHLFFTLFNVEEKSFMTAEEIENGMHLDRLHRLIDEFRTQANNRKVQVLFTTHSNQILDDLTPNQVIWCKKDANGSTGIKLVHDTDEYVQIKEDLGANHSAGDVIKSGLFD